MSRKKLKSPPMVEGAHYEHFRTAWIPQSRIADIICAVCAAEWDDEREKHSCRDWRLYYEAVKNARLWLDLRRKILTKRKA